MNFVSKASAKGNWKENWPFVQYIGSGRCADTFRCIGRQNEVWRQSKLWQSYASGRSEPIVSSSFAILIRKDPFYPMRGTILDEPDARYRGVLVSLQAEHQFGCRRDERVDQQIKAIIPQGFAEGLIADGSRSTGKALVRQIGRASNSRRGARMAANSSSRSC